MGKRHIDFGYSISSFWKPNIVRNFYLHHNLVDFKVVKLYYKNMKKIFIIITFLVSILLNVLFISNGVCEIGCYTTQTTGDIITANGWQHNQSLTINLHFQNGNYFVESIWNNDKSEKDISRFKKYVYFEGQVHIVDGDSEIISYTMDASVFTIKKELQDGMIQTYTNYIAILLQVGFIAIDVMFVAAIVLAFKKKN